MKGPRHFFAVLPRHRCGPDIEKHYYRRCRHTVGPRWGEARMPDPGGFPITLALNHSMATGTNTLYELSRTSQTPNVVSARYLDISSGHAVVRLTTFFSRYVLLVGATTGISTHDQQTETLVVCRTLTLCFPRLHLKKLNDTTGNITIIVFFCLPPCLYRGVPINTKTIPYRSLPLFPRPRLRCLVTELVKTNNTVGFRYRPDHYRGVSLPSMLKPQHRRLPLPPRPSLRCLVTENAKDTAPSSSVTALSILAVFHHQTSYKTKGKVTSYFVVVRTVTKMSGYYRENPTKQNDYHRLPPPAV